MAFLSFEPMIVTDLRTLSPRNFADWNVLLKNEDPSYILQTRITWWGQRRVDIVDRQTGNFVVSYSVWELAVRVNRFLSQKLDTQELRNQGNALVETMRELHRRTCEQLDASCWLIWLIAFFRCETVVPRMMFDLLGRNAGPPFTIQPVTIGLSQELHYKTSSVEYSYKDYAAQEGPQRRGSIELDKAPVEKERRGSC